MIRSTKIPIIEANVEKLQQLKNFILEYRRVATVLVDYFWETGLKFGKYEFDVSKNIVEFPTMLPINIMPNIKSTLTARATKCLSTQVCGIINAAIKKRKKDLWLKNKLESENKSLSKNLLKRLSQPLVKPTCIDINPELNSICCDVQFTDKHFNAFIALKSIFNTTKGFSIKLPVRFHRHFHKLNNIGKRLNSLSISDKLITIRFEIEDKLKTLGSIIGADQGLKTVLTLSNGKTTPEQNKDGYSLDKICDKIVRKRKGSIAFSKAQDHRKNFINWSINQLNIVDVKQINLEKIININFARHASRKMQAWTNTIIRDKLVRFAAEHEVRVILQNSSYRSQRCSCCGSVRKANRKGKVYECKHCGNTMDADLNAAKNHEINLPDIPFTLRGKGFNLGNGFFWKPSGLSTFSGEELTVPLYPTKS